MKGFVHNCIAHPVWWAADAAADGAYQASYYLLLVRQRARRVSAWAQSLHDRTAPEDQ